MNFKLKNICFTGWEKNGIVVNVMKKDYKSATNMNTNFTKKTISGIV